MRDSCSTFCTIGAISKAIGQLQQLVELDLSENQLEGQYLNVLNSAPLL
jgi:hypothetical protein